MQKDNIQFILGKYFNGNDADFENCSTELLNLINLNNTECSSNQSYSDCHIHADNKTGCLGCGNLKRI